MEWRGLDRTEPQRDPHTNPQIQIPTDNCIAIDRRAGHKCKCIRRLASAEIIRRLVAISVEDWQAEQEEQAAHPSWTNMAR